MNRTLLGSAVGAVTALGLGFAMLPFRSDLSIATAGLVLVVPVVAGVITGGFVAGVVSVVVGFLVYDVGFIPPYGRVTVGTTQDWVALVVYAVIMLLISRVVASLEAARARADRRTNEAQRLSDLSELLVGDQSVEELLKTIVRAVATVLGVLGVTVLVPHDGALSVAASSGEALTDEDLRQLDPQSGVPISLGTAPGDPGAMRTVALAAAGRPVGMLVVKGAPADEDHSVIRTFANHAALALERAQLREQALRSELLDEVDRLRHALLGAVSHDLRTPLASLKVASSTLSDPALSLSAADQQELHGLIDLEIDRLTRLVNSLLDMTRFDAGALELHRQGVSVSELAAEAVASRGPTLREYPVEVEIPDSLPAVEVDPVLIGQVLANLLDNANRHAPQGMPITIAGATHDDRVAVSVSDRGPGVPPAERDAVFDRFVRFDTGGAPASGSPSPRRSSKHTASGSGSKRPPAAGPGSSSPSRLLRSTRIRRPRGSVLLHPLRSGDQCEVPSPDVGQVLGLVDIPFGTPQAVRHPSGSCPPGGAGPPVGSRPSCTRRCG